MNNGLMGRHGGAERRTVTVVVAVDVASALSGCLSRFGDASGLILQETSHVRNISTTSYV